MKWWNWIPGSLFSECWALSSGQNSTPVAPPHSDKMLKFLHIGLHNLTLCYHWGIIHNSFLSSLPSPDVLASFLSFLSFFFFFFLIFYLWVSVLAVFFVWSTLPTDSHLTNWMLIISKVFPLNCWKFQHFLYGASSSFSSLFAFFF